MRFLRFYDGYLLCEFTSACFGSQHQRNAGKRVCTRGYSLLMILLSILALGLLSLSSVSLRSASQGSAQAQEKANARLALVLAIAELQKQAGSDMRITAPADIPAQNNSPLTGVWKSWEGTNHTLTGSMTGRPTIPDYARIG
jgi:type II secretory pathway component PulJ